MDTAPLPLPLVTLVCRIFVGRTPLQTETSCFVVDRKMLQEDKPFDEHLKILSMQVIFLFLFLFLLCSCPSIFIFAVFCCSRNFMMQALPSLFCFEPRRRLCRDALCTESTCGLWTTTIRSLPSSSSRPSFGSLVSPGAAA